MSHADPPTTSSKYHPRDLSLSVSLAIAYFFRSTPIDLSSFARLAYSLCVTIASLFRRHKSILFLRPSVDCYGITKKIPFAVQCTNTFNQSLTPISLVQHPRSPRNIWSWKWALRHGLEENIYEAFC